MASPYAFLPQRAVLSLTGPDVMALLERLVTHNTTNWTPGESRYGALLTPQGKVIADYIALRTADGVLIDVDKAAAPDLLKRLKMFRLRSDVTLELSEDLFVIAGLEAAEHGVRPISGAQHVYLDPRYSGGRLRGMATKESWAAWYGYHPAEWSVPLDAYHSDRIANGVPEQGADFTGADVFPHEINMDLLGGVDLKKGCFVGQEVVSRVHRRGKIRKRSLALKRVQPAHDHGVEAPLFEARASVDAGNSVGALTSVEGDTALALIRIDRLAAAIDAQTPLTVGGAPVALEKADWLEAELAALSGNDN